MDGINPENAVLAQLVFGIGNIKAQMEAIELMAKETAIKSQKAFQDVNLMSAGNAGQLTAQQAMSQSILKESEVRKAAIVAEGEAKISAIQAKESLTRQAIAQKEAQTQVAILQKQMAEEKIMYMQSREAAFAERQGWGALMERRLSWLGAGGLVLGGTIGISEVVSTINEVEKGMTTIARVTEDVNFNFKQMRDELQQLGVTYGDTWADVSDIAIKWAQAGYNQAETLELTKDSLLALNTAELNSEQATSGLIAIMAQWGLTSTELLPTIDKINKVADDFAITSTDLVAGLQRSSGAAKVLGLSLNETIAILTAMRESTGRTGKEVGNALNSILSFMQRPVAIKAFETEGIQVFADTARTEFRNVIDIFGEMAQKWPQMSEASRNAMADQAEAAGLYSEEMAKVVGLEQQYTDIQQRDLSQAAAGIYRRNYLLALLQNWSKVDEVLISQENSLGYSMKENERTMQTLDKQVEVLKASAEQLAVALGDAGLLNELKGLIEGLTDAVQWFNNLDDDLQTFLLTVGEVTLAVKLLDAALKMAGVSALLSGGTKVAGLAAIGTSFAQAAKGLAGFSAAAAGASAAASTLGRGIMAGLGGPVGIAIIGIGTALGFIIRETNKANEELIEHGAMAKSLAGEYDSLISKMSDMAQGTEEYNKTAKELVGLKGSIAESLPEVIQGYDEETNSIIINRAEIDKLIKASNDLKQSKEELKEASDLLAQKTEDEVKAHQEEMQRLESKKNIIKDLFERKEKLTEALARQSKESEEAKRTQESLGETEQLIAGIAKEAGLDRNATMDDIINKLSELKIAELKALENTQTTERDRIKAVKDGALKRLEIINQELSTYNDPLSWGFFETAGNLLKQINPLNSKNYDPTKPETAKYLNEDNLKKEKARAILEADAQQRQIDEWNRKIKQTQNNVKGIKADIATSGPSNLSPSSTSGSKSDAISLALESLGNQAKQFELANYAIESGLDGLNNRLALASTEYEYLAGKVTAGTATSADFARMQELVATKTSLLSQEQTQLALANQEYQREISALKPVLAQTTAQYEKFRAAGDSEHTKDAASAVSSLQQEIDRLSGSISENTQKVWQNKSAIDELNRATYSAYYQQATSWAQHMESIGRMTKEQQIDYLRTFDQTRLALQDQWKLQEEMFKDLKGQMSDYMEQLDTERDSALDAIESRVSATVAGLQAQIDALNNEKETDDRAEAERQHNEKIAKLQEDRRYHELRTGAEHQDKIKEIDEQIAEENRDWQKQQADWIRDDKKEGLQNQIDDVKKAGDDEKDAINDNYDKAKRVIDKNMDSIVAGLMARKDEWKSAGEELINALIEGIKSGDFASVTELVDSLKSGGSEYLDNLASNTAPTYSESTTGSTARDQAHAKAETARAELINAGYAQGAQDISSFTTARGSENWYNSYIANRTDLPSNIKSLFKEIVDARYAWENAPKAHIGASVAREGLAKVRYDERILSPRLTVSFDRLAAALATIPDVSRIGGGDYSRIEAKLDKAIAVIEKKMNVSFDKVVNIENFTPQDVTDVDILGRETARKVLSAL